MKELYINGMAADISNVEIVLNVHNPIILDATKIKQNGSYTVQLPMTEPNMKIFGLSTLMDVISDIPYVKHEFSYFDNGFTIVEKGEAVLLDVTETINIQLIWGINQENYSELFTKKLNEIKPNGTTITADDWIVKWNKYDMYAQGKKYKHLDYISGERESDITILNDIPLPMSQAPEPFKSNLKQMTHHPFVAFHDMLDLINYDTGLNIDFQPLKDRLADKGLILGGMKDKFEYTNYFNLSSFDSMANLILLPFGYMWYYNRYMIYNAEKIRMNDILTNKDSFSITLRLDFSISKNIGDLKLMSKRGDDIDTILTLDKQDTGSAYKYDAEISLDIEDGVEYYFAFNSAVSYTISGTNPRIYIDVKSKESLFWIEPMYQLFTYYDNIGRYNCLANLPDMTYIEFINQMMILTGSMIKADDGEIKFINYDNFKARLDNDEIIPISNIGGISRNDFHLSDFAQKNIIKFNNSDDKDYNSTLEILVNDKTLEAEKDLYVIEFDLADTYHDGRSEFILYKQAVTQSQEDGELVTSFKNTYSEKSSVAVMDVEGAAINLIFENTFFRNQFCKLEGLPKNTKFYTPISASGNYVTFQEDVSDVPIPGLFYLIGELRQLDDVKTTGVDVANRRIYFDYNAMQDYLYPTIQVFGICDFYTDEFHLYKNNVQIDNVPIGSILINKWFGDDLIIKDVDNGVYTSDKYLIEFWHGRLQNVRIDMLVKGIPSYYDIFKRIVDRPRFVEVEKLIGANEFRNFDVLKPIFINEFGRYGMVTSIEYHSKEASLLQCLVFKNRLDKGYEAFLSIDEIVIFGSNYSSAVADLRLSYNDKEIFPAYDDSIDAIEGMAGRNLWLQSNRYEGLRNIPFFAYTDVYDAGDDGVRVVNKVTEDAARFQIEKNLNAGDYTWQIVSNIQRELNFSRQIVNANYISSYGDFVENEFNVRWGVYNVATQADVILRSYYNEMPVGSEFYLRSIKLEKGDTATPWTPAPEDSVYISDDSGNVTATISDGQLKVTNMSGLEGWVEVTFEYFKFSETKRIKIVKI